MFKTSQVLSISTTHFWSLATTFSNILCNSQSSNRIIEARLIRKLYAILLIRCTGKRDVRRACAA